MKSIRAFNFGSFLCNSRRLSCGSTMWTLRSGELASGLSEPGHELGGTKSIALTFNLTLLKVWGKSADWATMLFKLQRLMKTLASWLHGFMASCFGRGIGVFEVSGNRTILARTMDSALWRTGLSMVRKLRGVRRYYCIYSFLVMLGFWFNRLSRFCI